MKSFYFIVVFGMILFNGCVYYETGGHDISPVIVPPAPQGIYTITRDESVYIGWLSVNVPLTDYYKVYRSNNVSGPYVYIGKSYDTDFTDDCLENGVTYYYAISAVSTDGVEGPLSSESIHDTPRPEGWDICLYDANCYPDYGALDVVYGEVVSEKDRYAGIVFYSYNGIFYMEALNGVWIQDMGYTDNFDEISTAPSEGWSEGNVVEAIEGHTYVMWTPENLFAKIRISYIGDNYMICDWGCQIDPGNPEIKR